MYLQTVGFGLCYAGIRPNIPEFSPLRRLIAHMSRTRKWPPSPSSPPVPDPGPDQTKGPLCCARRSSVATMPHAQARQAETRVDQGLAPTSASVSRLQTFGDLIDLHITDMCEVGKPPRRSEAARLITLRRDLGKERTDSSGLASTLGGTGARGRTSPTAPSVASTIATG